ncbi:MAG TPA: DUF1189 family protein [bacterium]|nr:DUF1189 family protein [bacterium]HPN43369.1 DUF1189 family protein [bacterium]
MHSLLFKKYLFFLLLLPALLTAIFFIILPLANKVHDYVTLYRQALVEPFPAIRLMDGKLEFVDPVPVNITIGDAVQIICDTLPDTVNFSNTVQNSILISEYFIMIKSHDNKVEKIDLTKMNINDEPVYVDPYQVSHFIDNRAKTIIRFVIIMLFIIFYLFLLILTTVGAGIGVMVDAFSQSKISFLPLLNISGIVVTFYTMITSLFYYLHIFVLSNYPYIIGLMFLTTGIVVYFMERSAVVLSPDQEKRY